MSIAWNMTVILRPVHDTVSIYLSIAVETRLIAKHDIVRYDSLWINDSQGWTRRLLSIAM
jgi:hypothetical protein